MKKIYQRSSARTILEETFLRFRKQSWDEVKRDVDHAVKYGIDDVLAALFSVGYTPFNISDETMVGQHRKIELQRRVDVSYPSIPLCQCNDKVFVNATVFVGEYHDRDNTVTKSIELNMTHELTEDEWIKLHPYGMPLSFFKDAESVLEQEKKVVTLWAYAHAIYNDKL